MNNIIRVLIVEDAKTAQFVAKSKLLMLGCEVDTDDNSVSTLEKTNTVHYDLILMDLCLGLESLDGFEIATLIKSQSKLNKKTHILALTMHSEVQFNKQAKAAGILGFICKPFSHEDAAELVDCIKNNSWSKYSIL